MTLNDEILELENKFWQSVVDKDARGGARLCADPFLITGAQGVACIERKSFMKMMEGGSWTLHAFELSDVKVKRITNDVAAIAYKVHEDLTVDGQKLTIDAADASTWARDGDMWFCVLHTESVLGDPYGRDRKPAVKEVG
jgi:hypothetical protein